MKFDNSLYKQYKSWNKIQDQYSKENKHHHLHLICPKCKKEMTCRCTAPKDDITALCSKCFIEVNGTGKIIDGNLLKLALQNEFDVILHGCNCFCTMGGGIAKQIKDQFPEAYQADLKTKKGDKSKLGTYTSTKIIRDGISFIICNCYTQFMYSSNTPQVDYNAIRDVMKRIAKDFPDKRIGYPLIGAGLAGGDWNLISNIINEELAGLDHVLVNYKD